MNLVQLGNVATYGRMDHEEARLKEEIDAYLNGCDEKDAKDGLAFGPDHDEFSLPEELRDTETRKKAIANAKRELEARIMAKNRGNGKPNGKPL
jgi:hypothetical protein